MAKVVPVVPRSSLSDPFLERAAHRFKRRITILGQDFRFESNSRRMLKLVDAAYARLPKHRLRGQSEAIQLRLHLTRSARRGGTRLPADMQMHGALGLLCGTMDSHNFAALSPATRTGLVVASPELLSYPYEARYQLIEFAVFTLACRGQGLIPLHAACIGLRGRGLLLMGESGAGKSTLSMLCAANGMEFLTEDATFVAPESMLGTGVTNYLHVRKDALRYLGDRKLAALVRKAPVIRRRSGIMKYEVDLRTTGFRLAAAPLEIAGVVFLTRRRGRGALLMPMPASRSIARLELVQSYGAAQPGWREFARRARWLPAYEMRRGEHPLAAVEALRSLLESMC
jgi:hypothetical protein